MPAKGERRERKRAKRRRMRVNGSALRGRQQEIVRKARETQ